MPQANRAQRNRKLQGSGRAGPGRTRRAPMGTERGPNPAASPPLSPSVNACETASLAIRCLDISWGVRKWLGAAAP